MIAMIAAGWWLLAVAMLVLSTLAALLHPHLPWQKRLDGALRPVSAIVPVKHWNPQYEDDQASLFAQDYPELEILFATREENSPALDAVRQVEARYPAIASRIIQSPGVPAASPKLGNLWPAIGAAKHDLILTKDCNVHLTPGDLENLVRHHGPGVGLVSTISITTEPRSFGAWIEASIINNWHGRLLMLASALGLGVGCGKIMLFSRADLERAGGLGALSWAIGEDEAMERAFHRIGLRTALADRTSGQVLGERSLAEVWQRQLRWMLIWRLQTPFVFVGNILTAALPALLAAALAAPLAGATPMTGVLATFLLWFGFESLLCRLKGWPLSGWSLPAFVGRESLSLLVWLRALTTSKVVWGGVRHQVAGKQAPGFMILLLILLDTVLALSLAGLIAIGLGFLSLPLMFLIQQHKAQPAAPACPPDESLPPVLVQLAVFNEPHVVSGLLAAIAGLDWPRHRLVVQLLDDSTDDTPAIAAPLVAQLQSTGLNIVHLRRDNRAGFKAGALAAGLALSNAPFIAVLDADFRPPPDWLRRIIPHFLADPRAGFVQSRCEFSNWRSNALTRAQGLLFDCHFVMEQNVRARAGWLFQFNGTAGAWRRATIEACGGWSGETLTEDLDLTVRAEIAGWHGVLVMAPAVGGLVPERMHHWRVQQRRWASGFVQNMAGLLGPIARADWSAGKKLAAAFLILYQTGFVLVSAMLLALAADWGLRGHLPAFAAPPLFLIVLLVPVILVGMTLPPFLALGRGGLLRYGLTVITLPPLFLYLSLANTMPMIAAFFGMRESFKRTPKLPI